MSTQLQREYINDLAVKKVKEFKEIKELIISENIVDANTDTAAAKTLDEITNRLTDAQAAKLIDVLIARSAPSRSQYYSDKRIKKVINGLDKIKAIIDGWDFS